MLFFVSIGRAKFVIWASVLYFLNGLLVGPWSRHDVALDLRTSRAVARSKIDLVFVPQSSVVALSKLVGTWARQVSHFVERLIGNTT